MPREFHRGGNPGKEVDSDQDNDAAPISGSAVVRRQEQPPQGSARRHRSRPSQARNGVQQAHTQSRRGVQQAPLQPALPRPAAPRVRRAEAAAPTPGHRRSQSIVLQPALGPQLALGPPLTPGPQPSFDFNNIFEARIPLPEVFQAVSHLSAQAEMSQSYGLGLSSSLLNSSALHVARGSRPGRLINQQEVFNIHRNITIGLMANTERFERFRGVMVSGLLVTIVHVSTAKQLGWRTLDVPPIASMHYYVEGMGSLTPRKWLYAGVKFQNFEGLLDVYVASDDYPPFPFVLLQDNSLEPLGSRRYEADEIIGYDPHAQPGSALPLDQLDYAASTLYAASPHGGHTTANTTLYAPSDTSLSFGFASSGVSDFMTTAGQEGPMPWLPTTATTLPPAQPDSKVSQREGTMATPRPGFYGQNGQGLGDPAPAFH